VKILEPPSETGQQFVWWTALGRGHDATSEPPATF
jgi:hypothetical protein